MGGRVHLKPSCPAGKVESMSDPIASPEGFDPLHCVRGPTRQVIKSWIRSESQRPIPWSPLSKSLADCRVALVSTAGIRLKTDKAFDAQGERDNPWWGDPSYREIPNSTRTELIHCDHLHINTKYALEDINSVLPIEPLAELVEQGFVGSAADTHYSVMGYQIDSDELEKSTTPIIANKMLSEQVDIVVLVPV